MGLSQFGTCLLALAGVLVVLGLGLGGGGIGIPMREASDPMKLRDECPRCRWMQWVESDAPHAPCPNCDATLIRVSEQKHWNERRLFGRWRKDAKSVGSALSAVSHDGT